MKKTSLFVAIVTTCSLLAGCGTSSTLVPTPDLPTPTPTSGWHPRCFMAPQDRPRPEEHIPCPGDTTMPPNTSAPATPGPISDISIPTTLPVTPVSLRTLPSPRTPVTASDIACLQGHWREDVIELNFQYLQMLPTMDLAIEPTASLDFNFFTDGTFTETINNLSVYRSTPDPMDEEQMDQTQVKISGLAKGTFHKDDRDGKIYFTDLDTHNVVASMLENGQVLLPEGPVDLGMLPGIPATDVAVSCTGNKLTLTYHVGTRNVTVYLYKAN